MWPMGSALCTFQSELNDASGRNACSHMCRLKEVTGVTWQERHMVSAYIAQCYIMHVMMHQ